MIKTLIYEEENYCYFVLCKNEKSYKILISKEDKERLEKYKWHKGGGWNNSFCYFSAYIGGGWDNQKIEWLHRFILDVKGSNIIVDHINRNTLDNRRENLRIADSRINAINSKIRNNNTSEIVGVSWRKDRNCWCSRIKVDKKYLYLGSFSLKEEAIEARKVAELLYYYGIKYEN